MERSRGSPGWYFFWVGVATLPLYMVGIATDAVLVPGVPLSGLAVVCPAAVALGLVAWVAGGRGVVRWLARAVTMKKGGPWGWLVPALALMPGVMVASYFVQGALGTDLPLPGPMGISTLGLGAALLVAAFFEELGWSGYATEPLSRRFGVLGAALILGSVWALWHWIPLLQVHRPWDWMAWWTLGTLAHRLVLIGLYRRSGGVVGPTLYHASINLSWQLFPVQGSMYDPAVTVPILMGVLALWALFRLVTGEGWPR